MTASDIRQTFLDYFAGRGHTVVPSSSLLIKDDPSLLFTNAGMNQFKVVFLGQEKRPYATACSSQKCFRVSGKHNDLENVGVTPRHHTFFEMLGNFSFGDYFKKDAIAYAWEFLTKTMGLDPKRLWATVYTDDDEAEALWRRTATELGDRVLRFGERFNYWSMGDVGPCGPCSEIHYDFGPAYGCGEPTCTVNCDCDRYLEIWNLVFMQFNRQPDGTLVALPKPSVDTGMGFERLASLVQGKHSNYETDLFQPIIQALAADSHVPYDPGPKGVPHRVCADHLRGLVFTIADGGMPGNDGAGYVLRRILRRAARHGATLGYHEPFLHRFVDRVIDLMRDAYPELSARRNHIVHVIESEEARFDQTLDAGLARFETAKSQAESGVIPGEEAFRLYDTFGFPVDLTELLAREAGLTVDIAGFEKALADQRARSRSTSAFETMRVAFDATLPESTFVYDKMTLDAALLWVDDDETALVLDRTPFYAEAGGQINDAGQIVHGDDFVFQVERMEKVDRAIVHHGRVLRGQAHPLVGQTVTATVDASRRHMIQRNHTATHLLHRALRTVLGDHAQQAGSLVAPDRLRFDFSHTGPLTPEQLDQVEQLVNREILANTPLTPYITDHKRAIADGVTALFGEKYGDTVRVVKIGDYSSELCGGTHVRSTGEIGQFRVTSETGVAAGIRRIEAITGEAAFDKARVDAAALRHAAELLKTSPDRVIARLEASVDEVRSLRVDLERLRKQLAAGPGSALAFEPLDDTGITVLVHHLAHGSLEDAKAIADQSKARPEPTVAFVYTATGEAVTSSSKTAASVGLDAGKLFKTIAHDLGGRGGGRPDFAQGKITLADPDRVRSVVIDSARAMIKS